MSENITLAMPEFYQDTENLHHEIIHWHHYLYDVWLGYFGNQMQTRYDVIYQFWRQ